MRKRIPISAKYICLDIVGYTRNRSVNAQLFVRETLDDVVNISVPESAVPNDHRMFLPTGDGMCIALINFHDSVLPFKIALNILEAIKKHNSDTDKEERQFDVRIGLHYAHTDHIVTDINERDNIAGAGINTAFRIMGLADEKQILISPSVYDELITIEEYKDAENNFEQFRTKIRHGIPITVYQFTGASEAFLSKKPPSYIEEYKDFMEPAADLGLTKIYQPRDKGIPRDIEEDIANAKSKVWILDAGPSSIFNINDTDNLGLLNSKIDAGVEVKILLPDALRSPAILRASLEGNHADFEAILEADRRDLKNPPVDDPYNYHPLYVSFREAYTHLKFHLNSEDKVVRFYPQTPMCWAAIIDEKVYFQPYTFGDTLDDPRTQTPGRRMPVIKLQGQTQPTLILEDHIDKLWRAAEVDLFHVGGRIIAKKVLLWKMFQERLGWFKHFHMALHNDRPPEEQRAFLRQPCFWGGLVATVTWKDGEVTKARMINLSREGVLMKLRMPVDAPKFTSLPEHSPSLPAGEQIIVRLDINPPQRPLRHRRGFKEEAGKYLVDEFLRRSKHEFRYIRKEIRKEISEEIHEEIHEEKCEGTLKQIRQEIRKKVEREIPCIVLQAHRS